MIFTDLTKSTYTILILILLLVVVFAVLTIFYAWLFFKAYQAKQEADQRLKEDQQLRENLSTLEQQYNELRKFKHDYQNMLLSLEGFVKNGSSQQFAQYYQELLKQQPVKQDLQKMTIANIDYLKNDPIRGIVIQKTLAAKNVGVNMLLELIEDVVISHANILTVVRILGVLLDNAIEQAQKEVEKKVICAFVPSEHMVEVIIDNVVSNIDNLHQLFDEGYTTKANHQGLGLANVRQLIKDDDHLWLDVDLKRNHLQITLTITEEG
ncbi:GHKL domain-containing protein [Bombilactobacillus folatiphilus]|uniref:GHKL domain-containing protein n=1 Tax=Bombilactobacillus folatiphilus TaxID=2923362 RepID=A0ABY4P7J1_9LACO|nr:GHKL domain-containing protein [Bombilactobacillus folatiphilus]UQS81673.1 GHKL domain-containing protein [Bombilactobacillus folatiphilus]